MTIISEEAMALAAHQKAEQNRAGDGHDEARKALADIYGYMLRPGVDYQSGDGTNAPAIIFADADYEVGDGKCGLHEDSKSANEPAIIYVRSDAIESAYAQIAAIHDVLDRCEEYFDKRADAEYFTGSPSPIANEEMRLLVNVRTAIRAKKKGAILRQIY